MVKLLLKMQVTEVTNFIVIIVPLLHITTQKKYIPIVFLLYIITKCCYGYDIYYAHTLLSVIYEMQNYLQSEFQYYSNFYQNLFF